MDVSSLFRIVLLLLSCFVYHSGNSDLPVTAKKGSNVTLTCEFNASKIVQIDLFSETGEIDVCLTEECSGRVFKKAACDIVIKNLSFSDAGKYTLRVHYNNDQSNVAGQKEWRYHLHIHDEITVKIGKPLMMDVLLSNAHKVEKNSSEGWKEVWSRGHGVRSNRMNDTDGNLIINKFMDSDAGTYRVLDAERTLITVTVMESDTESAGKQDTEQHQKWILPVVVCLVILVLLSPVIVITVIKYRRRRYIQGRVR